VATVRPAEASGPGEAHDAPVSAAPETARWLRRWVAVAVGLLTLVTVVTAFAEDMPASHRLAVPPAAAVMLAAWMVELSGVRWPRFGLIAANVLPNLWLALIHHGPANYLFLLLLVAWVALVGSRAEGAAAFVLSLAVGAACFSALGIAVTSLVPNPDAAPAVINATILPLLFISDIFIPLDQAPTWLGTFSKIFPVRHLSNALVSAYNPFEKGSGYVASDLIVMGAWGVAGIIIAIRFFSWEPRVG
jgi:hypothetical protein